MASLHKFLKKHSYHVIPLSLNATNHLEVIVEINGISGRFILDTGASNTCVGLDKVDFFELVSEESQIKAAGAGAIDMTTLISKKNKLQIGAWKKKKQKIVLFDLIHVNKALKMHNTMPVDGIIGADVLKKAKGVIDYKTLRLYLLDK